LLTIPIKVTFVVAPVIMLYKSGFCTSMDQIVLAWYVLCGVSRLARFNVTSHLTPKDAHGRSLYHQGLPVSLAALLLSTAIATATWMGWMSQDLLPHVAFSGCWYEIHPDLVMLGMLGSMMISKRLKLYFDDAVPVPVMIATVSVACWLFAPS
jgi:CDP-diacylglycerol--serine O-phosphatidyltransferase